jgi:hypothetical protein
LRQDCKSELEEILDALIVLCITKWPSLNNFVVYFLIFTLVDPFLFGPQAPLLELEEILDAICG